MSLLFSQVRRHTLCLTVILFICNFIRISVCFVTPVILKGYSISLVFHFITPQYSKSIPPSSFFFLNQLKVSVLYSHRIMSNVELTGETPGT